MSSITSQQCPTTLGSAACTTKLLNSHGNSSSSSLIRREEDLEVHQNSRSEGLGRSPLTPAHAHQIHWPTGNVNEMIQEIKQQQHDDVS